MSCGRSVDTCPRKGHGLVQSDAAPPWALSSLLAGADQNPSQVVRLHAQLRGLSYPVLKSMKVESREFFNTHISTTFTTLGESYFILSGMTRDATIEWLMDVSAALRMWSKGLFDEQLLWKALNYLDGFYGSAWRESGWSAGCAQERALAAVLLAWKMNENMSTSGLFSRVISIVAEEMDVSMDISVVLRMEVELVSVLDFKTTSPSVVDLAEAVGFYFRLLGSSMCADITGLIARVLMTAEDIVGSIEPVNIVLAAARLALPLCHAPEAISGHLLQEICKMFDEPDDAVHNACFRNACTEQLRRLFEVSTSRAAVGVNVEQRLRATLCKEVASLVGAILKNARVEHTDSTGTTPEQESGSTPARNATDSVEARALDGRHVRRCNI
eukprot:TRINITY_DN14105_c2_g3_i2.p1 TRINITY_DN14105_c2_g3~~TRINITY_DN14105_c2_g3_i2.p1  ORF type:complete len:405 (+),score=47.43 TRINITY_DN14105_c2_g3_i2:59-1216(+)